MTAQIAKFSADVISVGPQSRTPMLESLETNRRYFSMPAQATAYKIVMLEIQRLRAKAQDALKASFDMRGFHDQVLGSGPLPLPELERKIDQWIAGLKRGD